MIIWFDMDGVLCNMIEPMCREHNKKYGTDIKPEDITEWTLSETMKDVYRNTPNFFRILPPIPGMIDLILETNERHEVHIASDPGRVPKIAHDKMQWLRDYGLGKIPVTLTETKYLLRGDILIDDAVHHVKNFQGHSILVDAPYNRLSFVKKGGTLCVAEDRGNGIAADILRCIKEIEDEAIELSVANTALYR